MNVKSKGYFVAAGSVGKRRDFQITVGLREGWSEAGRIFDIAQAVRIARAWMARRIAAGQPALSGMFTRAEVTYAWLKEDGSVGSDQELVAIFSGDIDPILGDLSDAIIEDMLNELAGELGADLSQAKIQIAYSDRSWVLNSAPNAVNKSDGPKS
jgi:hypothetical protein